MRKQSVLQSVHNRLDRVAEIGMGAARRVGHGDSAWSLPRGLNVLRQPQDGAPANSPNPLAEKQRNALSEPDDARITGGTRSLSRRLLGLNVTSAPRKVAAAVPVMGTRRLVA
jgi:hypothetical protein